MNIKVGNIRTPSEGYIQIKCYRPFPLGNPYRMRKEADRSNVCKLFQQHIDSGDWLKKKLVRLELLKIDRLLDAEQPIELICYCYPKQCHCDSIKHFLLTYRK